MRDAKKGEQDPGEICCFQPHTLMNTVISTKDDHLKKIAFSEMCEDCTFYMTNVKLASVGLSLAAIRPPGGDSIDG
jgi:hypothetical protein